MGKPVSTILCSGIDLSNINKESSFDVPGVMLTVFDVLYFYIVAPLCKVSLPLLFDASLEMNDMLGDVSIRLTLLAVWAHKELNGNEITTKRSEILTKVVCESC